MMRKIKKYIVVNAITGEAKIRTRVNDLLAVEVAFALTITLPEAYARFGTPIEVTLPILPEPKVEVLDGVIV